MLLTIIYYFLLPLVVVVFIYRTYYKCTTGWNKSYVCLNGKTAIVTGANIGIGFWTAQDLAMRGARVILACRNLDKANIAKNEIMEATKNPNIIVKQLDLASFDSIRKFASDFNSNEDRLDILINNAGVIVGHPRKTVDGLLTTWQSNHFGPFLLTHLLVHKLKKAGKSRIVNVSSIVAESGNININKINDFPKELREFKANLTLYNDTKLANILFTRVLAKKLSSYGIIVNCLHPGAVRTNLIEQFPTWISVLVKLGFSVLGKNAEEGAQTTNYLAVSKDVANVTGKYFMDCKEAAFYKNCLDMGMAEKLWLKSEEIVQLGNNEKIV